jgi:hypothetical protein
MAPVLTGEHEMTMSPASVVSVDGAPARTRGLSWALSLVVHLLLICLLWNWQPSAPPAPVGFQAEPSHIVGLVVENEVDGNFDDSLVADQQEPADVDERPERLSPVEPVPRPAIERPLTVPPATATGAAPARAVPFPVLGPGQTQVTATDSATVSPVGPAATVSPARGRDPLIPGTSFMGIEDEGTRVVFVVDASASMETNQAMRSAKSALVSSLQQLTDQQQFQVLFYNKRVLPLTIRGKNDLAFATELNKSAARQAIQMVEPGEGTEHYPALVWALKWQPEVLYLLTDANEPQLSTGELDELRKMNRGRTRIHTIEFGFQPRLTTGVQNFLQRLAQQNGGTYRYHDVSRAIRQR